ncbi:class I SAM-dependent methyltransferase [Rhodococcus opacus]|uniref:hypothetical protein n=1 Tax=Rhodococcus opacus TaxID=37919 RepID=UPI0002A404B0|nr:hypothetical protein [Rhodococcus opacus]ELB88600.1 hypothetical protein Rwratislav_33682 [Rhodococcus wratislaviensis IFP 2016]MDX5970057.1 class I SAM-dependent methyltransferase [Rhodococcus opacus]CAG7634324.1 hypothetical protein E143388_07592 [Rhodococcus opacus]
MQGGNAGQGKANFDDIYDKPDPREYFRVLAELEYQIPQRARPVFAALLAARRRTGIADGDHAGTVLDLCCSYGVNAALLRCDLSMTDLVRHYADPSLTGLPAAELEAADRAFYAAHRRPYPPRIVGVDAAANAVGYGRRVGLLERGAAENLETGPPSAQLTATLADVGLITATGGVGYITERTFDALLRETPAPRPPWVAAFVLRIFPYDRIAETLHRHGLLTEELAGVTFPQRRFASPHERDSALDAVRARGLDPAGKEDRGQFHACFYLSRPASDVEAEPLAPLLNGLAVEAGGAEADAAGPRER